MNQAANNSDGIKIFKHIIIVTGVLLLPSLQSVVFGWLYGFVPLLVFYYICRHGGYTGAKYILTGTLIALVAGLILQVTSQTMLAITLMPAGFMLARSVEHGEGPALAGFKGVIVLAFSWFLVSGVLAFTADKHPYSLLILSINQGMDDALKLYQKNEQITAESFYLLSQTITQIKDWLIRLMPAILISIDLILVWLAMALGNSLLQKHTGSGPWSDYQYWQLPEKLVWSVIAAASLALLPVPMARTIGFNILLIVSIIYCFQGLAIVLFFLDKWKTPLYVRFLLYMILFFQSLGIIFLSIIGLADVWFTFRHADKQDPNQKNTE